MSGSHKAILFLFLLTLAGLFWIGAGAPWPEGRM